ncbi:unnamed protein product [Brassicogethes aeneus]|uniref:rRNA adenine N(6)-methyltransferase n=1 Tax=Brassicogethes aeneus TaxID=1431903 RepID=A0A9P0B0M2_BRAAE|nr:unnamed protein product [Brassicogethes aeneus]
MNIQKTLKIPLSCPVYRKYCSKIEENVYKPVKKSGKSHTTKINNFFRKDPDLAEIKEFIPEKYLDCKRKTLTDNLYLICAKIARRTVRHVMPAIKNNTNQIVCETNAGLGFISSELLRKKIPLIRLYESCPEFREMLKDFDKEYKGKVEIFTKDLFLLHRYSWMDKIDHSNRVELLLKNVPRKKWTDEPCMTLIGPMSKIDFIKYLMRCLTLQSDIVTYGRVQIFAIMRPKFFTLLDASPKDNLHTYTWTTVLFQLFFDYELLEKFDRDRFLPWETASNKSPKRYVDTIDRNKMYLVKINFKKDLPVPTEDLLPLYFFVQHFFHRGRRRVIQTVEKWVPGGGLNIILPQLGHENYCQNMDIMTTFGELTPQQILGVFREMRCCDKYENSPFKAMIESQMMKLETIETDLHENAILHKTLAEDIEVKINE